MDLSLEQRRALLDRCIKPKHRIIEVVVQKPAKTANDIIEALDTAIMARYLLYWMSSQAF
jgi:ATP-dependent DNA ligase